MDNLETLIREIEARYQALLAANVAGPLKPVPFLLGGKGRKEAQSPPHVIWVETGGGFGDGGRVGGNGGHIGSMVARVHVLSWHETVEKARNTLLQVILATRQQARGRNVAWQSYEVPTEEKFSWAKRGALFEAIANIDLPIPAQVVPEGTVGTQDHQVIVGGEVVC